MQLTLKLKMAPDDAQRASLLRTMVRFNEACDDIGIVAFQHNLVNKLKLQRIVYYNLNFCGEIPKTLYIRIPVY